MGIRSVVQVENPNKKPDKRRASSWCEECEVKVILKITNICDNGGTIVCHFRQITVGCFMIASQIAVQIAL